MPGTDRDDITAREGRAVGLDHQVHGIGRLTGIKLIHIIPDGGVETGVHRQLQPLVKAHVQHREGLFQVLCPLAQGGNCVVGAGVIHRHQFILLKSGVQHSGELTKKCHRPGAVIVQINHR